MDQRTRRLTHIATIAATVIGIDLATKTLTTGTSQPIVGVEPVTNPGLALGVANPTTTIVIAMAIAGLVIFGGWCIQRTITHQLPAWPTGLLLGGAIANLIDRVAYSAVRDFIATPWVIFNLADIALATGVAAFLLSAIRRSSHQPLEPHGMRSTPSALS